MVEQRRAKSRQLRVAVAAVAVVAVVLPGNLDAAGAAKSNAKVAHARTVRKVLKASQVKWRPKHATKSVRVLVRLKAEPAKIAVARAADAGTRLNRAEVTAASANAAAAQARTATAAKRNGVRITHQYTTVVNGFSAVTDAAGVNALWAMSDVASVEPVRKYTLDNSNSNLFTKTFDAWTSYGVTGAGQKIAVIDTGIDYTHSDLGGSGDPADYANNDGAIVEPGSFPTAKVIGGYDFVGDDYDFVGDGGPSDTPAPDADPIDCEGHGSHVSGTAAGNGVLSDGSAYAGPYTKAAALSTAFKVAPGSAPQAKLMAYRVFGCDGSAGGDVIVEAIDRAVADGATVINMSLGSTYGRASDVDSVAVDNAMLAGTVVVMAAGNEGPAPYMVGGPAVSKRGLAVAAADAVASFPGGAIDPAGANLVAINANGATTLPLTAPLHVVPDGAGGISLGCSAAEYDAASAGTIAVIVRGACARTDKPGFAEEAGAVGTIMINNAAGLPPFEGQIPNVSGPFFGVDSGDEAALVALDGTSITLTSAGTISNPGYSAAAPFSSAGPRSVDGGFKPEVSAPGVGVFSAASGTGSDAASLSGTSMASPHAAGVAALVRQSHPGWSPRLIKAAMVNTANADAIAGFEARQSGNGAVVATSAVATRQAIAGRGGDVAANFYFRQLSGAYDATSNLEIYNSDKVARTYTLTRSFDRGVSNGAVVTVSPSSVTVPAGGKVGVAVRLRLSAAASAAIPVDYLDGLTIINGQIVATPTNGGTKLTVPFLMVPRPRSDINSTRSGDVITAKNTGLIEGTADVYSWLLSDGTDPDSITDVRALGVQYLDDGSGDPLVIFAMNLRSRMSNPAEGLYDILIDVDRDGEPDHEVLGADEGLILDGSPNGFLATFVFDLVTGDAVEYGAVAPTDGSIVELGFFASDLGLDATTGPVPFVAEASDLLEGSIPDGFDNVATIDPFHPQTSMGDFVTLARGESAAIPVARRVAASGETLAKGWMVVTVDDRAGARQADLVG